jgi:hypothetical protein
MLVNPIVEAREHVAITRFAESISDLH